jgi:adenylosuccinate lyase
MAELGLDCERISTQIVAGDAKCDFIHAVVSAFSVLANLADDFRNLQRTEIGELREHFAAQEQVGSSTMPHKANPVSFENVKSIYKAFLPRVLTAYLDQISEHQRDLTNSASQRFIPELLNAFTYAVRRMRRALEKIYVDRERMREKLSDVVLAEALYVLLAAHGFPEAYEYVKSLVWDAHAQGKEFMSIVWADAKLDKYLKKFSAQQLEVLRDPAHYCGIAAQKTVRVCEHWQKVLAAEGFL